MSNQKPSNRRRRIAGERRPATPATQTPEAPTSAAVETAVPPAVEPAAEPVAQRPPTSAEELRQEPGGTPSQRESVPASTGRGIPLTALVVLGLLAALAVGLATYFWTQASEAEAVEETQSQAPSAAERAAQAVLSYSHESLDRDKSSAVRFLTDDYGREYSDTFEKLVRDSALKTRAQVEAEVVASAVSRSTPDRADVLLFVNQTTTSTASSGEPQTALNREMFDMVEVDGTWLVDGITSY
jgi:Mce-associated membrane protein